MIPPTTGRRRAVLIGAAVLLLGGVALAVAAEATGGTARPALRHQDYIDGPAGNSDQCSLPVAQRTGGWVCPAAGRS